jgi:hypothetical protein
LEQVNQTQRNSSVSIYLEEEAAQPFVCAFYNPDFIIYSSLGSFYIPCCIMVILYFRIFKVQRSSGSSCPLGYLKNIRFTVHGGIL